MDKFSVLLLVFGLQWFQNVNASIKLIGGNPIHHSNSGIKIHNSVNLCSCHKSCQPLSGSKEQGTVLQSYVYDAEVGSCVQPLSSCVSDATCAFSTEQACMTQCVDKKVGKTKTKQSGCKSSKYGCCPDGSSRPKNGKCLDPVNGSSDSMTHGVTHGVRWDLVASGLCVLVLLVAVLSVSGVMAYHYKERQKEKIRSRYIHNVLEMYESDSDISATEGSAHKYKQETTTDMVYDTEQPFIKV